MDFMKIARVFEEARKTLTPEERLSLCRQLAADAQQEVKGALAAGMEVTFVARGRTRQGKVRKVNHKTVTVEVAPEAPGYLRPVMWRVSVGLVKPA